ncbi:MAG: protein-L-isoaspartate(D-aspartate) O-methyltransferase [Flavobacteriales bacterium]
MEDSYRHKGLRRNLIRQLRLKGIKSDDVLEAMESIPRHWFLSSAFLKFAYEDQAFPIGSEQTISHPFTVAFQTSILKLDPGMKVLEIGTGSGYQTCVLEKLGAKVYSIERQKALYLKTDRLLAKMRIKAKRFYGDGYKGKTAFAPYDRVLVTCGAPDIPELLLSQVRIGGILVIPVGEGDTQEMLRLTKNSESDFSVERFGKFSFVPMLQDREMKG